MICLFFRKLVEKLLRDDDASRMIVAYSQYAGRIAGRLERIALLLLQIGNAGQ